MPQPLSQAQVDALSQQVRNDPRVRAILSDPNLSTPLKWGKINDYLTNDPSSPTRGAMGAGAPGSQDNRGGGVYRYDINTGGLKWEPIGPQHWYTDPGVVGPIAVGTASGLGALGMLPGMGGAAAAGGAGGAAAGGVPSMPWTIPAGFEASMGAAPLGSMAAGAGAGAAAGAAGAAGGKGLAGGIGGKILDSITSGNGIAGLAGLIATLASRPSGGGGNGDPFATNPQLQGLLDMSAERARRTDPLHQSITQLAMQRLPTNVQR